MTQTSSTQGALGTATPSVEANAAEAAASVDAGMTISPAHRAHQSDVALQGNIPSGAVQAYSMLSIAANVLATAAGAPPQPSPVTTLASQGLQFTGPWIAGAVYGVVPGGPLTMIPDNGERWYAIARGRYLSVTNSATIADGAVTRVSHGLRISYNSQQDAVNAFNQALALPEMELVKLIV
ncbi:hypothetical protein C8F04DRAFT_1179560 [Mycena alexandri]|uniref:Uncharacterized protein n=1 Tax=Mycena alexandri TaxID=1745969 RepID=A0AAD6X6L2_9AGAR|nr:hypothetical protein C8F04DRAFT_1179560 [Mycena alexandri]